jgi:hypothetical protein
MFRSIFAFFQFFHSENREKEEIELTGLASGQNHSLKYVIVITSTSFAIKSGKKQKSAAFARLKYNFSRVQQTQDRISHNNTHENECKQIIIFIAH